MKNYYRDAILEAIDCCEDTSLLDLVLKLLLDSSGAPVPAAPVALEVKINANYSRNSRLHGAVPVQVRGRAAHPGQNRAGVGDRWTELPGVCGGADCLQSAA